MTDLRRLLSPASIAVIGGGAWSEGIINAAGRIGFKGRIIPVNPKGKFISGLPSVPRIADIDTPVDAAFVGVNRKATIDVLAQLRGAGAGGAVAFASGFSEASAELADGADLQKALLDAAGNMPVLGPNCYGFVNALDRAALWPDQHGMVPVDRGVAILTQSSNIAINLTMQRRALPIAMTITCGNQAQLSQAAIAQALLEDDRITAIGLHIEGFGNLAQWEALASAAQARGIPLVALKVGASEQAQAATVTHTASLAGSDAGAKALMARLGIRHAPSLTVFLEMLKLLHLYGPLPNRQIASISCSGGEASLAADRGQAHGLDFPPLSDAQQTQLAATLGPKVALANPLDYHTYIWRDGAAMASAWAAMARPDLAMTLSILDYPRADRGDPSDWDIATKAALAAKQQSGARFAVVSSLPELLPEDVADTLMAGGVLPLNGLEEGLAAIALATDTPALREPKLVHPQAPAQTATLTEAHAKARLAAYGIAVPEGAMLDRAGLDHYAGPFPVVLKGQGAAHKSEAGLVAIALESNAALVAAADRMEAEHFLIEEMITGGVAELLIGVTLDPAHGYVLTLAAGGTMTELLSDSQSLLLPTTCDVVEEALGRLKCAPLLHGFRGKPGARIPAILKTIEAVETFVLDNAGKVAEVEINPLICTPTRAVAADALIREAP
ncbi:MAG: acetate--CoA ligase family protein [Brevirhabdus sp.]